MFKTGDLVKFKEGGKVTPSWFAYEHQNPLITEQTNRYPYYYGNKLNKSFGVIVSAIYVNIKEQTFYICFSQNTNDYLLCFDFELEKVETNA